MFKLPKELKFEITQKARSLDKKGVNVQEPIRYKGCAGRADGSYRCSGGK